MRYDPKADRVAPSTYDHNGPINYEHLKAVISASGPFMLQYPEWSLNVVVNITPCQKEGCECNEDAISITQSSGFTSLSTLIGREQLEEFRSLTELARTYLHNPEMLFNPSAEQQYLEGEVRKHLGIDPSVFYENGPPLGGLRATLSDECQKDSWRAHNLKSIFFLLGEHRRMIQSALTLDNRAAMHDIFQTPNDFVDLLDNHYTIGFLTGRLISEHFVRYEIEPYAKLGQAFEDAQNRRNAASGKSSTSKRSQRIEAMLTHMERLVAANSALRRTGIQVLADLAIEDAISEDSQLWSQGQGQRDEYLDEMRSDIKYQERFNALRKRVM
ncbi:hypothetical protein ROG8370_00452 [Roseovarius gaetbuli]|uniref:Uncharacterized protein n=1 Tax=Roseovarius gaetbuli TaxID=1356575 RepID=A0A1X6YCI2_9RHOB|nr:hypothetical protein [Roseovarius gaetbuli]SLN17377.1 hypothetical protein ROG8370_00452 [Roseovarius gaetbuli]